MTTPAIPLVVSGLTEKAAKSLLTTLVTKSYELLIGDLGNSVPLPMNWHYYRFIMAVVAYFGDELICSDGYAVSLVVLNAHIII